MSSVSEATARDALLLRLDRDPIPVEPDPLLSDPRVPDAYAASVRAELRETVYQLKAVAGEAAA